MKIVVDENVSYELVDRLRTGGHAVISMSELADRGMLDEDIYAFMLREQSVLITRDYHFTNPLRFPTEKTKGIIHVRHGNLKSEEEIAIVENFLLNYDREFFQGKLVTLYRHSIRIR
ncbi:MAG: hypothetical protein DDT24_00312 [Chloroflexi bacterium]|nr:hypothetical protein [Chloroflexota bacterium]MBT9166019.1 hypothetical protein [Chloroflexota bacterium]